MRLGDLYADVGRPIAHYPQLRSIAGSTNAALLLCQLIYWHGKQRNEQGWIYKRVKPAPDDPEGQDGPENQSLAHETGLTLRELSSARTLLRSHGLVKERYARSEHRLYFQVDFGAISKAWGECHPEQLTNAHQADDESAIAKSQKRASLIGTYTDYTQTTAESAASSSSAGQRIGPGVERLKGAIPSSPVEAMGRPEIQLFRDVCGRWPGTADYRSVIETISYFRSRHGVQTVEYLRKFWLAWSTRRRHADGKPYDPRALTWLTEWALNGSIPPEGGGLHEIGRTTAEDVRRERQDPTPEVQAAAERINQQRRAALSNL